MNTQRTVVLVFLLLRIVCGLITLPLCIVEPPSGTSIAFYVKQNPEFWDGLDDVSPSLALNSRLELNYDQVAGYGLASRCGFIFLSGPFNPGTYTFSAAALDEFQTYYNAGGSLFIICESSPFAPNCPAIMNPVVARLNPGGPQFQDPPTIFGTSCGGGADPWGSGPDFVTNPNDLSATTLDFLTTSTMNIPFSDPNCIVGPNDQPTLCAGAQSGHMLLFADLSIFFLDTCDLAQYVVAFGQNTATFAEAIAGAGGDPHVFLFDGTEVELVFKNQVHYILYAGLNFRVVIQTTDGPGGSFITSVGVTIGEARLLAKCDLDNPIFLLNDTPVEDGMLTPLGGITLFTPEPAHLRGPLAELSRYLITGLKINHVVEIVGGLHHAAGCFFNVEVSRTQSDSGLLKAVSEHKRNVPLDVSEFETNGLFN